MAQSIAQVIESEPKRKRGRPVGSKSAERWYQARGIEPLLAAEILKRVDAWRIWLRLLESDDDRVVLQAMTFLQAMRDGRPAQQINVTSANVNISVDDVERARAIVREIRNGASRNSVSASSPLLAANVLQHTTAESESSPRTESENT